MTTLPFTIQNYSPAVYCRPKSLHGLNRLFYRYVGGTLTNHCFIPIIDVGYNEGGIQKEIKELLILEQEKVRRINAKVPQGGEVGKELREVRFGNR